MAFATSVNFEYFDYPDSNSEKNIDFERKFDSYSLDFYESIYHLKKMFPKYELDVIEPILLTNKGSVEKTIDELLEMSTDQDLNDDQLTSLTTQNNSTINDCFQDSPPSYNEYISSIKKADSFLNYDVSKIEPGEINHSNEQRSKYQNLGEKISKKSIKELNFHAKNNSSNPDTFLCLNRNFHQSRIMIGELSKDFLRIKLTNDQVKKLKATIKKAKRNELTAIMNEKLPEVPEKKPLSLVMKEKLDLLNEEQNPCKQEHNQYENQQNNNFHNEYNKERIQIIQENYLSKIIQNEDFLNKLKQNQDFMYTLDSITDSSINDIDKLNYNDNQIIGWENGENRKNYTISNAELKQKLVKMNKKARIKFVKIATDFTKNARETYNKKAAQLTIKYSNILSSHLKSVKYYKDDLNNDTGIGNKKTTDLSKKKKLSSENENRTILSHFSELYEYDHNRLPKIEGFSMKFSDISQAPEITQYKSPELNVFNSNYSYENEQDRIKEYIYDHSVYPPVKILNDKLSK